jgi:transposase
MKPLAVDLRQRILDAYLSGQGSIRLLAERFAVSCSTVWLLLKRFRATGKVDPQPHGGGQPAKLEVVDFLVIADIVRQQPEVTAAEVRARLAELTEGHVSVSTSRRALHRLGFTRKQKPVQAQERAQEEVQQARAAFEQARPTVAVAQVHVVDETGVNLGMVRCSGWAPCGRRVVGTRPLNAGPNISVIGSLELRGVTACLLLEGAVNGELFKAFVEQVWAPTLKTGDIVYLDNVKFHKVEGVRELVEACGAEVRYLPPYSPEYSPLELCWSKVQELL